MQFSFQVTMLGSPADTLVIETKYSQVIIFIVFVNALQITIMMALLVIIAEPFYLK